MASLYKRHDSAFWWIRYKDDRGTWKSASTGYRIDNLGDCRQAKLLAREKTLLELQSKPKPGANWTWVVAWIANRWDPKGRGRDTGKRYMRYWARWLEYLSSKGINSPAALRREDVLEYLPWRKAHRNTAIYEIKLLAQVMDEAIRRGYARENPARKLGLTRSESEHKVVWTPAQVQFAIEAAEEIEPLGWLHMSLLMGRYQAARIGMCRVPLENCELDRGIISFPGEIMKGGKPFVQPISSEIIPYLAYVKKQRPVGPLCTFPTAPPVGVCYRIFLDALAHHDPGFARLSHHGLRATWITEAALAGVPETLARRFVNHANSEVHRVYQRITATDLAPMLAGLAQYRQAAATGAVLCNAPL